MSPEPSTAKTKLTETEELFRAILEQALSSFLNKSVPVASSGAQAFDFKELKAALPGEVVSTTVGGGEGIPGKVVFAVSRESAALLGDLLLMGDGSASFSHDEHLEPIRDLFKETMANFGAELGKRQGQHIAFEDARSVLIDLTPGDFAGGAWTIERYDVELNTTLSVFRLVSKDFAEACYPKSESRMTAQRPDRGDDHDDGALGKEMGLVLDISLPITIELGRTTMLIRDIVRLAPGSVVELDKLSGEPVDLYVNNKLFAKGEVVVVDENFAVRVTELVNQTDRLVASRN